MLGRQRFLGRRNYRGKAGEGRDRAADIGRSTFAGSRFVLRFR
jgi:hypothetical protein